MEKQLIQSPSVPIPTYEEVNHGLWIIIVGIGGCFIALLKRLVISEKKALMHDFEARMDAKLEPIIKDIHAIKNNNAAVESLSKSQEEMIEIMEKIGKKLNII